jgi:hypothetical protein
MFFFRPFGFLSRRRRFVENLSLAESRAESRRGETKLIEVCLFFSLMINEPAFGDCFRFLRELVNGLSLSCFLLARRRDFAAPLSSRQRLHNQETFFGFSAFAQSEEIRVSPISQDAKAPKSDFSVSREFVDRSQFAIIQIALSSFLRGLGAGAYVASWTTFGCKHE